MTSGVINLILCFWALALGIGDQLRGRLPNLWLAPALVLAIVWMLKFGRLPTGISMAEAWMGVFVAALMLLPGYLRGQVGAGDVKCLATMGLFVGSMGVLMVTAIGYATIAGAQWWNQVPASALSPTPALSCVPLRQRVPLGPGLALGFIVYLLAMAPPAIQIG